VSFRIARTNLMRRNFIAGVVVQGLLASAALAAVTIPKNGTTPAPTGNANRNGRGYSAGMEGGKLKFTVQQPDPPIDSSVHFEWCFDEGTPTESKNKSASASAPRKGNTTVVRQEIPSGAKKVHWIIYWDVMNAAGEEVWTWAVEGTMDV